MVFVWLDGLSNPELLLGLDATTQVGIRNNAGVLELSNDAGSTWLPVATREITETFQLDGTDISNEYVVLTNPPYGRKARVYLNGQRLTQDDAGLPGGVTPDFDVPFINPDWIQFTASRVANLVVGDILTVDYQR